LADARTTDLVELTAVADGDMIDIVDDPGGSPSSKKITRANFLGSADAIIPTIIGGTDVTDILKLQGTSGNGTLTSPAIQALVGNNGGTVAYTVLNNGNVGIGTTSPGAKLDVTGGVVRMVNPSGINYNEGLRLNEATNGYAVLHLGGSLLEGTAAGDWTLLKNPSDHFEIRENGEIFVTIKNSGNVGIGTTAPNVKLDVSGGRTRLRATAEPYALQLSRTDINAGVGFYMGVDNNSVTLPDLRFSNNAGTELMRIQNGGNVGIGTTAPTNLLSLGGNAARIAWMERHTTANTAGNTLTVQAGGATAGATDKNGGDLILKPGVSTGTGESGVQIQGAIAGSTGTADATITTAMRVLGNKIGFYNVTPVARQVLATGAGATADDVITALQNLGLVSQS